MLATISAAAPAPAALADFWANVHVPRRTSTTDPGATPAKSVGAQASPATTASGPVTPPACVAGL